MRIPTWAIVGFVGGLLVLGGLFTGAGIGAAQSTQCQPIEDRQVCITDFSISDDQLVLGERGQFSVTLTNNGTGSVAGTFFLHTAGPTNNSSAYQLKGIEIDEGESTTITREINASTPGIHGFRITFVETETGHVFDVSEIKTIEVLKAHPKELGGPIDRTEIALGALFAAVLGMVFMGYRQFRS